MLSDQLENAKIKVLTLMSDGSQKQIKSAKSVENKAEKVEKEASKPEGQATTGDTKRKAVEPHGPLVTAAIAVGHRAAEDTSVPGASTCAKKPGPVERRPSEGV